MMNTHYMIYSKKDNDRTSYEHSIQYRISSMIFFLFSSRHRKIERGIYIISKITYVYVYMYEYIFFRSYIISLDRSHKKSDIREY